MVKKVSMWLVGLKFIFILVLTTLITALPAGIFLVVIAGLASSSSEPMLVFFVSMILGVIQTLLLVLVAGFLANKILKWE